MLSIYLMPRRMTLLKCWGCWNVRPSLRKLCHISLTLVPIVFLADFLRMEKKWISLVHHFNSDRKLFQSIEFLIRKLVCIKEIFEIGLAQKWTFFLRRRFSFISRRNERYLFRYRRCKDNSFMQSSHIMCYILLKSIQILSFFTPF